MSRKKKLADLYLVGIGYGTGQATAYAEQVLRSCRVVFHLTNYQRHLEKLCSRVVDLNNLYSGTDEIEQAYDRIYETIRSEMRNGAGVASVCDGHPLFYDDCHFQLASEGKKGKFRCEVVSGLSCIDVLAADLCVDFGMPGLQVFEATSLVAGGFSMNPSLHTLVMQLGEFETFCSPDIVSTKKGMFNPLERHLLQYYKAGHRAVVAFSDVDEGHVFLRTQIDRLDYHRNKIFPGTTLYIPPADAWNDRWTA